MGVLRARVGGSWVDIGLPLPSGSASGDISGSYAGPLTLVATANVEALIRAQSLDQMAVPAANVLMNGQRLVNVGDAIQPQDVPSARQTGAWQSELVNNWTRTSNTTFTQNVDSTSYMKPGTKLTWKESGIVKYGVISTVAFSAGITTITMAPTTDYVMTANPDSTTAKYSYGHPFDFPNRFLFAPVIGGMSVAPTQLSAWWTCELGLATLSYTGFGGGTSNATTMTLPLPFTHSGNGAASSGICSGTDNNAAQVLEWSIAQGVASMNFLKVGGGAFTATGTKNIRELLASYPVLP